jgi:hypothetical protein
MAITSLDGVIAGSRPMTRFHKQGTGTTVAGRAVSLFSLSGVPGGSGTYSTGVNGSNLLTHPGQIPMPTPSGNTYLASMTSQSSVQSGTLILCDRLWHNTGLSVTSTAAQPIVPLAFPSRDNNGQTNGEGVLLGLEVTTVTGTGAPVITCGYTNSEGVAGRSAQNIFTTSAASVAATFYEIGLQSGDIGVRLPTSVTLSATWTSGAISLVAYRPIASVICPAQGIPGAIDAVTGGLPRIYDSSVLFCIFIPQTTGSTQLSSNLVFTQG